MGTLIAMGSWASKQPGDSKLVWSSSNQDEVSAARKMFQDLKAKGFLAYSVKKDGDKGSVVREFDSEAEKIIMTPPLVGG